MNDLRRAALLAFILLTPVAVMAQEPSVPSPTTKANQLVREIPADVIALLEARFAELTKEFAAKRKAIDELRRSYAERKQTLEPEARSEIERRLGQLNSDFNRELVNADRELDALRERLLAPIKEAIKDDLDKFYSRP